VCDCELSAYLQSGPRRVTSYKSCRFEETTPETGRFDPLEASRLCDSLHFPIVRLRAKSSGWSGIVGGRVEVWKTRP